MMMMIYRFDLDSDTVLIKKFQTFKLSPILSSFSFSAEDNVEVVPIPAENILLIRRFNSNFNSSTNHHRISQQQHFECLQIFIFSG
jgi:hypothetical protein